MKERFEFPPCALGYLGDAHSFDDYIWDEPVEKPKKVKPSAPPRPSTYELFQVVALIDLAD